MCLNRTETCRWDLPQVKVHHYFLGEDSLVQAPGLKSPANPSLSHCPEKEVNLLLETELAIKSENIYSSGTNLVDRTVCLSYWAALMSVRI